MPFFPQFAQDVWNQLKRCKKAVRHDKLVTASMTFLSSVVQRNMHRKVFESEQALLSMIRDVVVPNIMFREHDEEMLEDNPLEYIRLDIEGSDASTRRRAACDLVRSNFWRDFQSFHFFMFQLRRTSLTHTARKSLEYHYR